MKIVVVGATGMLGQALCLEGLRRNHQMTGIARSDADYAVDISDSGQLEQVFERVMPDVVINTAAVTSLAACEKDPGAAYVINARPVAFLADYCCRHSIYFVQISTDHYFSGDSDAKHTERDSISLYNEYARTKYAGEAFALTCPDALIVRTNIVGFRRRNSPTFAEWAIQSLMDGSRMTLFDDFFTSSIHVSGFSSALFDLLSVRPSGLLNLAAKDVCNKKQFIEMLAEALGFSTCNTEIGSVAGLKDARRAESLGLDVSRAEHLLGYELPTTRQVVDSLAIEYRRGMA